MLSPKHNLEDCVRLVGKVINHKVIDLMSRHSKQKQKMAMKIWNDKYGFSESIFIFEPFYPT